MSFRTDRRRRMLAEEPASGEDSAAASGAAEYTATSTQRETYIAAALRDEALRLIDFVPLSYWSLAGLVLLGGLTLGGLAAAHCWQAEIGQWGGETAASMFDLEVRGGLATWASSTLWSLTAFWCLVVYSLRRHRLDDIRGRYRIWLPAAAMSLLLSLDAVVDCRRLGLALVAPLATWSNASPDVIWIATALTVAGAMVVRLAFELRTARLALGALALGVLAYGCECLAPETTAAGLGVYRAVALGSLGLLGQMFIFLAVGLFGRHVLLDASGLLKPRAPKPKRGRKPRPWHFHQTCESLAALLRSWGAP